MASPSIAGTPALDATTTAGTSHTINLPGSIAAGDGLIVVFAYMAPTGTETISATDWTNITGFVTRNGTAQAIHALYKQATGSEGATVSITSSTSTKAATVSYRITGHQSFTTSPQAGTGATGTSGPDTADPPSVSVTGGPKDVLSLACMAIENETFTGTGAPTNWTNNQTTNTGISGGGAGNGMIQVAQRQETNVSTVDPGVFQHDVSEDWVAQTIVIHPPAAALELAAAPAGTSTVTANLTTLASLAANTGYLRLPDSTDQRATTPDHASLDITGDIDIRVLAWFTDNAGWHALLSKGDVALGVGSGSYALLRVDASDTLQLLWDETAATRSQNSNAGLAVNGIWRWYRATLDIDDGGGNRVITFYYSTQAPNTDPASVTWTQYSQHTVAGATNIRAGTDDLWLGDQLNEGDTMDGRIAYAEVRDGIAGTIVTSPDFRDTDQFNTPTQLTDSQSRVWTVNSPSTWVLPVHGQATVTAALTNLVGAVQLQAAPAGTSTITSRLTQINDQDSAIAGLSAITARLSQVNDARSTITGSSSVTAALSITIDLNATVAGTSTITANGTQSNDQRAVIAGGSTIASNLTQIHDLDAVIAGTSSVTAALSNIVPAVELAATIAGTSTIPSIPTANYLVTGMSGDTTITAALSVIAAIELQATVAGTSTIQARLSQVHDQDAVIAGLSAITSRLDQINAARSVIAGSSTVTAALSITIDLFSAIAGTSTITGNLTQVNESRATTAGLSQITANGTQAHELDAVITGLSTITAALTNASAVELASAPAGLSAITARLSQAQELDAVITGTATVTALLSQVHDLDSAINGTSVITARATQVQPLAATVTGLSSTTSRLDEIESLAAFPNGLSSVTAALNQIHALRTTIAGTSTVIADLSIAGAISMVAAINGTSALTTALTQVHALRSTPAGSSTVGAALTVITHLASAPIGSSTLTANATQVHELDAVITGTSTVTALLTNQGAALELQSTIAGTSTLAANLTQVHPLRATVTGSSTVTAALSNFAIATLAASPTGLSTLVANLAQFHNLTTTATGQSTLTAHLQNLLPGLNTSMAGTSTVTASLTQVHALHATPAGSSLVLTNLTQVQQLRAYPAGLSSILAALAVHTWKGYVTTSTATVGAVSTTDTRVGSVTLTDTLVGAMSTSDS